MNNKMQLLVRPTQCGKTFTVLNHIVNDFVDDENIVNILFVDNSLLQSTQLCVRIENFEGFEENSTIILSSKSKVKSGNEIPVHVKTKGIRNIITCSNGTRAKNIDEFLKNWEVFDPLKEYKFNIYLDEADKFLTLFDPYLKNWEALEHVRTIMMVTATPYRILQEFGEIKIMKMEQTYDPNAYHRFSDSEFVEYALEKNQNRNYYELCLNMALENDHINAGNVFYFPGNVKKANHYLIKNMCLNYGFNCITINSDGCRLYSNEDDNKKFENIKTTGKEIATVLADLYESKNLNLKPLSITGMTCISRGISLSSPRMMLTHSILPPTYSNINNLYQSGGRLTNNMKQLPNFRKPVIYCTARVRSSICLSETRACDLASKAHRFDLDTVTVDDYRIANKKWIIKEARLETLEGVNKFLDRIFGGRVRRNLNIHDIDGFYVSSRLNTNIRTKDLQGHNRLLKVLFDTYPPTRGLTDVSAYMVYPVYKTELDEECTFVVRYKQL
jgi:hypothetical protein